jgi:hypothetical protein
MTQAEASSLKGLSVSSELELEKNHLQFLGYKVTEHENGLLLAEGTESTAGGCYWWHVVKRSHGVCFMRWLNVAESASLLDKLMLANAVNKITEMSCTSVGTSSTETMEDASFLFTTAFLEGDYDRSRFTLFVNHLNREYDAALSCGEFDMIWDRIKPVKS